MPKINVMKLSSFPSFYRISSLITFQNQTCFQRMRFLFPRVTTPVDPQFYSVEMTSLGTGLLFWVHSSGTDRHCRVVVLKFITLSRETSSASEKAGKLKVGSGSAEETPLRDQVFAKQPSFCLPTSCQTIPVLAEIIQKVRVSCDPRENSASLFFPKQQFLPGLTCKEMASRQSGVMPSSMAPLK